MVTIRKDKLTNDALGTGRRKSSVARVRIRAGSGKVTVNKKSLEEYFPIEQDRRSLLQPLEESGKLAEVDVLIRVHGGGHRPVGCMPHGHRSCFGQLRHGSILRDA